MMTPTCRSMREFDCGWYGVDVASGHTSVLPAALSSGALSEYMDFTPWFPTKFFSTMAASFALLAFTGVTSVILAPTSVMRRAHLSIDAHVHLAMHDGVVGADDVAELGDGLPMSRAFATGLGLERLCPEADLAHRVLGPVSHHVPDGGGFCDELVLRSGVQVRKSMDLDVALELDLWDGDVELLVVDRDLGGKRRRLVCGRVPDVCVNEHGHVSFDRALDLLSSVDDQRGAVSFVQWKSDPLSSTRRPRLRTSTVFSKTMGSMAFPRMLRSIIIRVSALITPFAVASSMGRFMVTPLTSKSLGVRKPAAIHEVILRAGVEAPFLDPMHVLLSRHAVHGVHGRKRHVDDLAIVVVLDVVVVLKVDATSSRGDRGGGSSVRELTGVTELAVSLGVVLAGGLRPFSLSVLLALLPGLVQSIPFGL